jgi:transcriptional regulator with XRE-family HTH domain
LQAELAAKAEVNVAYVSQLENNRKSPTLTVYFRLCAVLKITPSDLMKRIEDTPSAPSTRRRKD